MDGLIEIINSEKVQAVATLAAFGGVSLKDFLTNNCLSKIKEVINDTFAEEDLCDNQKEILFSSLLELENYFSNSENIDTKLFEELLKMTINGVNYKNELTKEYLKILKNITFLDLKIFKTMFFEKIHVLNEGNSYISELSGKNRQLIIEKYRGKLKDIPYELIDKSLDDLIRIKFLKETVYGEKGENKGVFELEFLTELGMEIMKLLK